MEMIHSVGESNYDYYLGIKEREIGFLRERILSFIMCVFFFEDTLIFKFIMHIKKITIMTVPKIYTKLTFFCEVWENRLVGTPIIFEDKVPHSNSQFPTRHPNSYS